MIDFLAVFLGLFIAFPFLLWLFLFFLLRCFIKDTKRAFHWSVDITTVFAVLSVEAVMSVIWHRHFSWWLLFAFCMIAGLYTYTEWKRRENVAPRKLLKGVWRITFIIFMTADFIFITYGLVRSVLLGS